MSNSKYSIQDLLYKKGKERQALSGDEIEFFIDCVTEFEKSQGQDAQNDANPAPIQEAQIGAMLMAIFIQGLNDDETQHLTRAMTCSGEKLTWPHGWKGILVDKHSTGGVGDKTSLVLAPVLAACGLKVPMISGRGLAHTGGTLDKLESIPGFRVSLPSAEMQNVLTNVGCCIVGQTSDIVPADKVLYKLRDATKTIMEPGLITGSIISKKAAESLDVLVLDVKYGKGAFCGTLDIARDLAEKMVKAGNGYGMKTIALLTDMNSPIGYQIGNALEVAEAIKCLRGEGPDDLTDLVKELGGQILLSVDKPKKATTLEDAYSMIDQTLKDGSALEKFVSMIKKQGVDEELADRLCANETDILKVLQPKGTDNKEPVEIKAETSGYIHSIDALTCGNVSAKLGANRQIADAPINHYVGLTLAVHVGDEVKEGSTLVTVHHNQDLLDDLITELRNAIVIKPEIKRTGRVAEIIKE